MHIKEIRNLQRNLIFLIGRQHLTEKARHTLFLVVEKTYHLLFPRVKGYTLIKR